MLQPTATLLAAFVGAASAIITLICKDFIFVKILKTQDRKDSEREILRLYVAPVVSSCEKLVWRFDEIFLSARHQFLKAATLPLVFNEYKRQSTLYRIASLLGWMRAIQLELNALPMGGIAFSKNVGDAFEKVRKALADGPEVEVLRLQSLCSLWNLGSVDAVRQVRLAANLERKLYAKAGNELKHDARYLSLLEKDQKLAVCRELADLLTKELGKAQITQNILEETVERAITGLSYREALIYRDWQDAIGDLMLLDDDDSDRRYKLVGFAKFTEVMGGAGPWIEVFSTSIVDIDFDEVDHTDFRAKQLAYLSIAVADILISLKGTAHGDLVGEDALKVASKLKEHHQNFANG